MWEKSCVIIGAGLAGLSAAYRLKKNKWKVTVLEARDRIGGRVFTHRFRENPKLYCELGGEWVGHDHKSIRGLCDDFGIPLIPHRFDYAFAESGKIVKTLRAGAWPFERKLNRELERHAHAIVHWPEK